MPDVEQRLIALEMHIADLDSTVNDLSDMVARQWQAIEDLKAENGRLKDRLEQLEADAGSTPGEETPPPHY